MKCALSAHGKEGPRRHPGQFECPGLQLHQSTKRPPFSASAGGSSADLFRAVVPVTTFIDTIHRRSSGTARQLPRALTSPSRSACLRVACVGVRCSLIGE
jgi:hypothetical protein